MRCEFEEGWSISAALERRDVVLGTREERRRSLTAVITAAAATSSTTDEQEREEEVHRAKERQEYGTSDMIKNE